LLGIIFTGGEAPSSQFVRHLLETEVKNALIVAADSGLVLAEEAGLKPGWIIGDMDSLNDEKRLVAYPAEHVIRLQHEKDFSDTEMAFSLAVEKGCDEIWIIGGGGGRVDHLFAIRSLFERAFFPRRWISANADIRCIEAPDVIRCSQEKGTVISVFPLGDKPWEAISDGLKWQLSGLPWDRGFFGLSNVAPNGDFSIKAEKGRFMVVLPIT